MKVRIVLEAAPNDVEECLSIGEDVWLEDEGSNPLAGPCRVISCEDVPDDDAEE